MACPICDKESDPKYRPFCSRRCADVDLGRWLKGGYAIPADEDARPYSEEPPKH
ncbi:DNA gyrase inhibitor YacG [Neogemmobacter tilapiae]|uniref:DNA gyrase inhibitor YacG n=1 Tax=Neogemmobacter tilapiae TaxID=875041 RepID=A0A918TRQ0_9RHOB|nr:DNA gyrase inhibitor YacG [Gemmobacter tilapiae]GHC56753.1 DNA gyrase inhibitor YacG [Gemmobacter tilapiae]